MRLDEYIREKRKLHNLTQQELAERVGVGYIAKLLCIVLITFPCLQMISSFLHSLPSPSVNRLNINTKR